MQANSSQPTQQVRIENESYHGRVCWRGTGNVQFAVVMVHSEKSSKDKEICLIYCENGMQDHSQSSFGLEKNSSVVVFVVSDP